MTFPASQSLVNFHVTQQLAQRISYRTSCLFISSRLEVAGALNCQHCDDPHEPLVKLSLLETSHGRRRAQGFYSFHQVLRGSLCSLRLQKGKGLIEVGIFGSGAAPR